MERKKNEKKERQIDIKIERKIKRQKVIDSKKQINRKIIERFKDIKIEKKMNR